MQNPAKTITLDYPVPHDGGGITTIQFRRPRVKEMRLFAGLASEEGGDPDPLAAFDAMLAAAASLSDLPLDVIEQIDAADMDKLTAVISDFFPNPGAPVIGGK